MMTVLLTGDTMMHPELFQEAIENTFGKDKFDLRIKKYTFNDAGFYLDSGTNIPSNHAILVWTTLLRSTKDTVPGSGSIPVVVNAIRIPSACRIVISVRLRQSPV